VSDSRTHRSAAPRDRELFAPSAVPRLVRAVDELSWMLERGYAARSSLELVGNRHELVARQRDAVGRCACSDAERDARRARRLAPEDLDGRALALDGFNLLTTVESALGGGLVLRGRDGCLRDLARLGGTWRRVEETRPALELVRARLAALGVTDCTWYLDRPVSNSGRLRGWLLELEPRWRVELARDSALIPAHTPGAWLLDLAGSDHDPTSYVRFERPAP
jgi:hypothetical protein